MSSINDMVREVLVAATKKFAKQKQRAAGRGRDYLTPREAAFLRNEEKRTEREVIKTTTYEVMQKAPPFRQTNRWKDMEEPRLFHSNPVAWIHRR
jgi:hypothetical protein